jgi:hypothetical protein
MKKFEADSVDSKLIASVSSASVLKVLTILLGMSVTSITLTMATVAGYEWGGTGIYQPVMVAISVTFCVLTHFILAISRSPLAWIFWMMFFLGSVCIELTFFSSENLHAGEIRAERSINVLGVEEEMEAVRNALNGIKARPVAVVAEELANTDDWKKRRALKAEQVEAKRAAMLSDKLVHLSSTATNARVSASNDPVIALLAEVTGGNAATITLARNLGFSILLDLIGPWLWYRVLSYRTNAGRPQTKPDPINSLRNEIAAGRCKPTVAGIRTFLGCGQVKAMELRRRLDI